MKVKVTKKKQVVVEMVTIELTRKDAEELIEDIREYDRGSDNALGKFFDAVNAKIG